MSRGKNAAKVNTRLRHELAESRDARARLERRVKDAEDRADEADRRLADALDHGHPELRAAVAHEQAKEAKIRELVAEGERINEMIADGMREALRALIVNAMKHHVAFVTPRFMALMQELYGEEYYEWLHEGDSTFYPSRDERRDAASMPPQEVYARMAIGQKLDREGTPEMQAIGMAPRGAGRARADAAIKEAAKRHGRTGGLAGV